MHSELVCRAALPSPCWITSPHSLHHRAQALKPLFHEYQTDCLFSWFPCSVGLVSFLNFCLILCASDLNPTVVLDFRSQCCCFLLWILLVILTTGPICLEVKKKKENNFRKILDLNVCCLWNNSSILLPSSISLNYFIQENSNFSNYILFGTAFSFQP